MAVFKNQVNFQCDIGSISHILYAANLAIAKNSWQSYFKKIEVFFLEKTTGCKKEGLENLFLHFLPPLHNGNDFSIGSLTFDISTTILSLAQYKKQVKTNHILSCESKNIMSSKEDFLTTFDFTLPFFKAFSQDG